MKHAATTLILAVLMALSLIGCAIAAPSETNTPDISEETPAPIPPKWTVVASPLPSFTVTPNTDKILMPSHCSAWKVMLSFLVLRLVPMGTLPTHP